MPLGRKDADRGLDLLWEFHNHVEDDEQRAAYSEAIASLHSYLTDLLPASQPSLRAEVKESFLEIHPRREVSLRTVQLHCGAGEKLGLSIDSVSPRECEVSPVVVSLVRPGSVAAKEGSLRRGDQLVEVDGRPLAHVSLERARWLLDSAERRGTVKIEMIPLGLMDGMKYSVSREDLANTLPASQPASLEGITTPRRPGTADSCKRSAAHVGSVGSEQQTGAAANPLCPLEIGAPIFEGARRDLAPAVDDQGSLMSSTVTGGDSLTRGGSFHASCSGIFQRRRVRKMHIMKGTHGLGLRIIGGKGSKYGNMGIFIQDIEAQGAAHSDGRLKPGDEILMVDGKSLVGLAHSEAVEVLKRTQKLVQLVVATEVPDDQSVSSSLTSIPDWTNNLASRGPPQEITSSSPHSLSPFSTGFIESGLDLISLELTAGPHRGAFGAEVDKDSESGRNKIFPGGEIFEMRGMRKMKRKSSLDDVRESFNLATDVPAAKSQRLSNGDEGRLVGARDMDTVTMETEVVEIVLDKPEGRSLGFTVFGGKGDGDGIFVRAIDPTGLAGQEGSLREGDQLLAANGKTLTGLTHKQSASIIRGLTTKRVVLRACRRVARRPSSIGSVESSSTEVESVTRSATSDMEATPNQRERDEAPEPPPDLPPPPLPPQNSDDSDQELTPPSPPPSPPPPSPPSSSSPLSLPPSMEHHVGPLSPSPLLPRVPSEEQADSETESEQEKEAAKRGEQEGVGSLSQDSMASEESRNREETAKSAVHLSGLEKPVMSTDESLLSDSDNGRERQTFVRRRRRNVIRISSGRNDSDIEVKGKLIDASSGSTPPPHGMMPAVGAAVEPNIERGYGGERKGEETGFSDSHISPPSEPSVRLTEQVKEVEGEGQEELQGEDRPPVGFQKLILQMKKRAHSGLGVTIVHGPGVTKGIFMVRRIMAGGVAARDKRVRPGDRLVAINNKSLRNLSHAEVLQTINEAPKEIQLEIWRDPEFELDATSSIYSIGSRSSILSDDDTEDSLSKRQSLISLERFARDGGRTRSSPNVARYSTSIVEHLRSQGHRASPRTPKRWSAVVLSPNIGPAGEILPSPTPLPTSPTHTFTPPNPLPSPNTLTPSPTPHSLSPTPEPTSPFHQSAQFSQPPPSPPPSPPPPSLPTQTDDHAASQKSESDGSQTPPPPPSPSSHLPVSGEDSLTLTLAQTSATQDSTQEDRDRVRGSERNEVERPKSLGPVPKGARLEHGPFEIEITKGIFGLGLTVGLGDVGMITVRALTTRSPITKDGNIRVGDHLLSINDTSLIGVDIATAESVVKGLTRGVVRFVAMAPPKDVTNINSGVKSGETITHQNSPPTHRPPLPSTPPPPLPSTPPPPPVSPPPELVDEPGIIRAKLQRFGTAPLGLVLEGGSDSPLKYIFVQSIASWSPAFNSGLFTKGDQLVMVGSECLIGMSLLQAKQVLEQAPAVVELVAQRKESVRQSPLLASKTEVGSASGRTRGRRMGREESKVDLVKRNELDTSKEESRERKFTGSLTLPERPREGDQTQFSRSISHTDIQTQAGSSISTSLAYATSNTNLNTSWNVSMSGPLRSRTMSVENLEGSSDSLRDSALYHQPLPNHTEPAEDVFVVKLHREAPQKLGLSIVGGVDNPSLQCAHVKRVLPEGLVAQDGRIKRGDRIISVNGQELACLTNNDALALLKSSGSIVSLEVARRVGRRSSQAPSPLNSQLQSRRSSGENTREPPSPVAGNRKRRDSSGSEGAPPTPPNLPASRKRRSRQESMSPDDNMPGIVKGKAVTMPRKLKSTEGVKIVELHKGPTGLGMQIRGGSDENLPITVREVFPGGTAHKSGKIHPGDVIIEVNNDSFENLTHKEALSKLKSYPQGIIRLLVRDRTVSLTRQAMHQQ